MEFDAGQKYNLLKFFNSCKLSDRHLASMAEVAEIAIAKEMAKLNETITELKIKANTFETNFSNARWVFGSLIGLLALAVSLIGLLK